MNQFLSAIQRQEYTHHANLGYRDGSSSVNQARLLPIKLLRLERYSSRIFNNSTAFMRREVKGKITRTYFLTFLILAFSDSRDGIIFFYFEKFLNFLIKNLNEEEEIFACIWKYRGNYFNEDDETFLEITLKNNILALHNIWHFLSCAIASQYLFIFFWRS